MSAVKWGVLSTASIGTEQVLPAMQESPECEIVAIASRSLAKAQAVAAELGIPRAYGSYEELLVDPEVEAVYNPLPNHLHVPLSIQAMEAGKHVLCEKPLALDAAGARDLIAVRERTGKTIIEAFMVRHHPQWKRARAAVRSGEIGDLRLVQSTFGYFNDDPDNIRNKPDTGGGALYDIGVYPIVGARYLYGAEPRRVLALVDRDKDLGTDILTSAILEFATGHAVFTVSTQIALYQRLLAFGTQGRLELQIPYNAPPDRPTHMFVDDGSKLGDLSARTETFDVCDQYRLQGEAFGRYLRGGEAPEFGLEDSLALMSILDALFQSAATGEWVELPASAGA